LTNVGEQIVAINSKKQSSLFIVLAVDICLDASQCKKLRNNYIQYQVDKKLSELLEDHMFDIKDV
jgi:hypothetical protein